ncbi:hypothetical protein PaG_00808 [Moesziomyces aphidis]|uniref:Uncharacterized protein n=1 Tax=Moesziomyces aphidis TaxID=84754 RepID=W3VTN6_MOEAP|nr:hypothetical protein PaG_00808 [Moesziomyces aphidis]
MIRSSPLHASPVSNGRGIETALPATRRGSEDAHRQSVHAPLLSAGEHAELVELGWACAEVSGIDPLDSIIRIFDIWTPAAERRVEAASLLWPRGASLRAPSTRFAGPAAAKAEPALDSAYQASLRCCTSSNMVAPSPSSCPPEAATPQCSASINQAKDGLWYQGSRSRLGRSERGAPTWSLRACRVCVGQGADTAAPDIVRSRTSAIERPSRVRSVRIEGPA